MIYANIVLTVNDEKDVAEIRELLRKQGSLSRAEPGCLRYEVYQSQAEPKVFLIIERWASQQALDVHRTAEAYTQIYKPKVLPRSTRVAHPSDLIE
jgi:quinol monooxygenase YgiN